MTRHRPIFNRCRSLTDRDGILDLSPSIARSHRIEHNRRFLPLKLVDCADMSARYPRLQLKDLRVVGRDDEVVIELNGMLDALAIDPSRSRFQDLGNKFADRIGLFR